MKRILAIIIATFLFLSTFVPFAFADYSSTPVTFWDKYLYQWSHQGDGLGVSLGPLSIPLERFGTLACHLSSNLCASSDDHLHHADSIQPGSYRTGADGHGVAICVCKFCGDEFLYRSDDLQQDYNNYLHDNNLDNGLAVTPDGGFIWYPTIQYSISSSKYGGSFYLNYVYGSNQAGHISVNLSDIPVSSTGNFHNDYSVWTESSRIIGFSVIKGTRSFSINTSKLGFFTGYFIAPISGSYSLLNSPSIYLGDSVLYSYSSTSSFYCNQGDFITDSVLSNFSVSFSREIGSSSLIFYIHLPSYGVVPGSSISAPSVPSSITINNNTYPVIDIDFNSRTVHVTDDRTIIYDDDHITIKEGDTVIQTINYIIEDDDPGTDPGNGDDSSTPTDPGTVDPGDASGSGGSGCCEQCALLLRQVNSYLLQIQTLVDQINDKLGPESDNYMQGIYNLLVEINTALDNLPTEPHKDYEAKLTTISNQLANIWGDLETIKTSLSAVQTNTATTNQKLDTVHADLQAVLAELQTQRGILSQILSVLRDMLGHITSIDSNVEELASEEDSQNFFDSFILKFHFIGDIFSIIRQLFADITNDAATVTFVDNGDLPIGDLSNQHFPVSGSPVPVGTAPQVLIKFPSDTYHGADLSGYSAIDMSWYAPYKSRVDALISGFLWIGYLWLLFKRAPGIVRGAAMIEETNYKIEDWKNGG